MIKILSVEADSIAEELGLKPGDSLLSINREPVRDLLDFLVAEGFEELLLEIQSSDGEVWEIEIEHDQDEPLGLELPHPEPKQCGNNCIFCFVHQLPRGMRRPLYIKDEDYRFSYLYGAYVTLSNLSETEVERIVKQKLSPLYVSVHTTDDVLRESMLGKEAPALLPLLQRLVDGGIKLHTQIVVCPDYNDGEALRKSCHDLIALAPGIESLAIVPIGLTGFRRNLPELRPLSRDESAATVKLVESLQVQCLERLGTRFVFAADELYLNAELDFPPLEAYEQLAQIENGVGLIAQFRSQAEEVLAQAEPLELPPISLVTGVSAADEVRRFIETLAQKCGLDLRVHVLKNHFFGGHVTVTGLLTGADILEQLSGVELGEMLLLPDVLLREGDQLLLDDVSVDALQEKLDIEIEVAMSDPWGIWDMLETLAMERSK
ncbi:MAG: DUF512 domain-containing protein [Desulfuromonadales bacterium]|nr:DUF512 domain-containing protein [Desulfuromonadales bacterium]